MKERPQDGSTTVFGLQSRDIRLVRRGLGLVGLAILAGILVLAVLGRPDSRADGGSMAGAPPAAAPTPVQPDPVDIEISVDEVVASGFTQPLFLTHAGDGSGRLFVVEKPGTIRIVRDGSVLATPFLDITQLVSSESGERGLLGLAFDPDFENNGLFYVNYTRNGDAQELGDTVVARYAVSAVDPDVADPASEVILLVVDQPYSNHNGGNLVFGPDGYLYIGFGDGGSGGDPHGNGQNNTTLLGALLRIGVGPGITYTIPADNPYVDRPGRDEIWTIGLRNPWRFSFDRQMGDLYIGDVGQDAWEEIDYLPAGTPGGVNLGWNCKEGTHTYSTAPPCDDPAWLATLTGPVIEYGHDQGSAVTGGYVYRGTDYFRLVGRYFYGDFGSGKIWSAAPFTGWTPELELDTGLSISSFGEDERGELYVVDFYGGTVRHLVDAQVPACNPCFEYYLPAVLR
jgi:glucose/arabinose dehydrogenase